MSFGSSLTQIDILLICVSGCAFLYLYFHNESPANLPPGPPPLPIVGNHYQIPQINPWETYSRWKQEYGDIIHITNFRKHIVILNSAKVALDLLDQKSNIYSSRPQSIMAHELMTFGNSTAFLPYGNAWRKHRTVYNQQMNTGVIQQFNGLQMRAVGKLLRGLVETNSRDYVKHMRHMAGSIVLSFAYGYDLKPENDTYMILIEKGNSFFAKATRPGEFLVDSLPWLKHIPAWMPGAGFQIIAREARKTVTEIRNHLFREVKAQMAAGTAGPSFVANSLSELGTEEETNPDVNVVKLVAAGIFGAGTDTSASTLIAFVLAMILYPEVLKKAQDELDRVIGPNRLPEFNDRLSLPYIDAIVKETYRWFPVLPTGIPHATVEEDMYNNYRIPAGSTVIVNTWDIFHDPELYPDPSVFLPERFIADGSGKTQPDPTLLGSFGICPGKNLGDGTVWLAIASLLSVFEITNALDDSGNNINVVYALEPGGVPLCQPQPFPCRFIPRSEETMKFIRSLDI
ncbi:hypothetical protein M422DRAFT_246291 [Sphaerobolus stellatus SS14]|nr:hypothetical protein M422DRAFT_246291 [Sphaerobolus stellatus SS14]